LLKILSFPRCFFYSQTFSLSVDFFFHGFLIVLSLLGLLPFLSILAFCPLNSSFCFLCSQPEHLGSCSLSQSLNSCFFFPFLLCRFLSQLTLGSHFSLFSLGQVARILTAHRTLTWLWQWVREVSCWLAFPFDLKLQLLALHVCRSAKRAGSTAVAIQVPIQFELGLPKAKESFERQKEWWRVEKAAKLANAWLEEIDSNFQRQIEVSNCRNFVGGEIYVLGWFNGINKPVGRFFFVGDDARLIQPAQLRN
jgi:hypothetical protein